MEIYFRWPNRRSLAQYIVVSVLLMNVIAIVLLWRAGSAFYLQTPGDGNIWFAYGRLTGLFAQFALLLELLFISRAPFIERPFGFDKLNVVHRWIGYTIVTLMIAHPFLLTFGAAKANGTSLLGQFADYLQNGEHVFNAYLGVVLLIMVIVSSVAIVRKKVRYESWYIVHLLTYVAVTLIFLHQLHTGDLRKAAPWAFWVSINVIAAGSVLIYRFLRQLWYTLYHRFRVASVEAETPGVWSIYLSGHHIQQFTFQPGQYVNIRFLNKQGWWQSHPFSFSAGPNNESLRFSIKAIGDFTKTLHALQPGTPVLIDGPLGQFVISRAERKKLLFIAGGIGITPLRALLDDQQSADRDIVLLYASRSVEDIALKDELDVFIKHGIVRVVHILNEPTVGYETGYIDREKITRLIPDFYDREVFLCGPPPMMTAVVKQLRALGFAAGNIHFEKFSF